MISFYIAVMMIWTCTVKAQDDNKSLIHKIGFDVRPSYVAPTSKFLKDDGYGNGLTLRKAASFHLKYGFQLNPNSKEGQLYPHTYQGIGVSYNTFGNRQELVILRAAYVFQTPASPKFLPGYPSIMSGISEPHLVGIRMMITIITAIRSSVLRSMPISIWLFPQRETIPLLQPACRGGFNALLKRKYSSSECGIEYDWWPDRTRLHAQSYRGKPS